MQKRDSSTLLFMPNQKWMRVMETEGVHPSLDHLKRTLPGRSRTTGSAAVSARFFR